MGADCHLIHEEDQVLKKIDLVQIVIRRPSLSFHEKRGSFDVEFLWKEASCQGATRVKRVQEFSHLTDFRNRKRSVWLQNPVF